MVAIVVVVAIVVAVAFALGVVGRGRVSRSRSAVVRSRSWVAVEVSRSRSWSRSWSARRRLLQRPRALSRGSRERDETSARRGNGAIVARPFRQIERGGGDNRIGGIDRQDGVERR